MDTWKDGLVENICGYNENISLDRLNALNTDVKNKRAIEHFFILRFPPTFQKLLKTKIRSQR